MPLAPPHLEYLGKECFTITSICSLGLHGGCSGAISDRNVGPCDCRCHDVADCPSCDFGETSMLALATHMMTEHADEPINSWGDLGKPLLLISTECPPSHEERAAFNRRIRYQVKYTNTVFDYFHFLDSGWSGHQPDASGYDNRSAVACRRCSWEAVVDSNRTLLKTIERHLLERHHWKVEIHGPPRTVPIMEGHPASEWEIDTSREPDGDDSDELRFALKIVELAQVLSDPYGFWPLFTVHDLAALLNSFGDNAEPYSAVLDQATSMMQVLEEDGWIAEIRDGKYRAKRKLAVRCLAAGLHVHREAAVA
jgi:hypothetical protein